VQHPRHPLLDGVLHDGHLARQIRFLRGLKSSRYNKLQQVCKVHIGVAICYNNGSKAFKTLQRIPLVHYT
jgi:hypothetical protein